MEYITTFFAHIGAIRFNKICKEQGINSIIMPVPRNLSSSCGTCVKYESDTPVSYPYEDEVEQVVKVLDDGKYEVIFCDGK